MDTLPIAFIIAIALLVVVAPYQPQGAIVWFIGLFVVALVAHVLKYTITVATHHASWTLRPPNAPCHCDYGTRSTPGFPSGHAATAAYYVVGLAWLFQSPIPVLLGLPWVLYVGYQRLQSHCHTPTQVVAGYLLGAVGALTLYLYR